MKNDKMYNEEKNLIVAGNIATGKTTKVVMPLVNKMIENKSNLFILDSKQEYINEYYNDLINNNYNVVILNLRDCLNSEGWNPLEYPYSLYKQGKKEEAIDYIEKLGKVIFHEENLPDPFWINSASDFFTGLTIGLFEDGKKDSINLNSICSMFNGINNKFIGKDYITNYFELKGKESQGYIYASTTFLAPVETKESIVSVARQKLRSYVSRENLSHLLSKTTFDMETLGDKPTAIFFIGKDESKNLNTICAMFVEQLYNVLISNNTKFNFILDNFDTVEYFNGLSDMLSSAVSRNIRFVIVTRSLEDTKAKYSDYILKISDLVNDYKSLKSIELKENNVTYPKLKISDIKLFDLESFVLENKKDEFLKPLNIELKENTVDELLEAIDKKIKELDEKITKKDNFK